MTLGRATADLHAAIERFQQIVKATQKPPMWANAPGRTRRTASAKSGFRRVK